MGKIIAINGLDGSGKCTQTDRLRQYVEDNTSYKTIRLQYPNYNSDSSALVKMYLSGKFGSNPMKINPYAVSMAYALDRYISYNNEWKDLYEDPNTIIILDRYTSSNVIHQAVKVPPEKRIDFANWIYDTEYNILGLPKPDIDIYLSISKGTNISMMLSRDTCNDIHENESFQSQCKDCMDSILPEITNLTVLDCMDGSSIKSIDDIHIDIVSLVQNIIK